MINTYNESNLHATLKKIYALESNGTMEVKLDDTPWICDILDENGNAIEIQTSNLSALTEKAEYILETGRKLRIVHPIAESKWIELYDTNGELLHRKKSPKKASFYDSLRGMTQICTLFLNVNLELEILYCEISELRRKTAGLSQNQTKTRRHLKGWVPMGKRLEKITRKERLNQKEDWEKLIPESLRIKNEDGSAPKFRACDLTRELKKEKGAKTARWSTLLIWILVKMQILKITEVKGRSKFYSVLTATC
ncbi:MAG: hypothetical protein IJR39_04120 [Treponema sp.]|nr:hypothetical protein [Treponema sp.]